MTRILPADAAGPPELSVEYAELVKQMLPQLLITCILRLGNNVAISASEIDATGGHDLSFRLDPDTNVFHFSVS
jgi:hypothetical protein